MIVRSRYGRLGVNNVASSRDVTGMVNGMKKHINMVRLEAELLEMFSKTKLTAGQSFLCMMACKKIEQTS